MGAARFHVRPGRFIAVQHAHKVVDQRVAGVVAADEGRCLAARLPRCIAPPSAAADRAATSPRVPIIVRWLAPFSGWLRPPNAPRCDRGDGAPGQRQLHSGEVLDTTLRVRVKEMRSRAGKDSPRPAGPTGSGYARRRSTRSRTARAWR